MASLTQLLESFDHRSEFDIPENWLQGRTAYGGISAALALQAALRRAPDPLPPLKTGQMTFVGPIANSVRLEAHLLRKGKSTTAIAVDCKSGADIVFRAMFLFCEPRPIRIRQNASNAPDVDAAESYANFPSLVPAFFSNFDVRFTGETLPVSGSKHPEFVARVRHKDASAVDPAIALVALGDCLPPAAVASFTHLAPVSSMCWTFDLARPAQPGEWFLMRSTSQRIDTGYSYQTMDVWDGARIPVMSGCQTIAVFD